MSESDGTSWRRGRPSILLGRLLAAAATLLFAVVLLGEGVHGAEGTVFLVLMVAAAAAVAVACWDAALGALLFCLAALGLGMFGIIAADRNQVVVAVVFAGPYLVSAGLLWYGLARLART